MPSFGAGNMLYMNFSTDEFRRYSGFSGGLVDSFGDPFSNPIDQTTAPNDDVCSTDGSVNYRHSGYSGTLTDSFTPSNFNSGVSFNGTGFVGTARINSSNNPLVQYSGFSSTVLDSFQYDAAGALSFDPHAGYIGGDPMVGYRPSSDNTTFALFRFSGFTATVKGSHVYSESNLGAPTTDDGRNPILADTGADVWKRYSGFSGTIDDSHSPSGELTNTVWDDYSVRTSSPSSVKYRAEFENHNRTWRIDVSVSGYSGEILDRWVQRDVRLVYGNPQSDQNTTVLPSHTRLQISDEDGSLFSDINSRPDSELKVDIYSTDGAYDWNGEIRTDTVLRTINPDLDLPVVDVYAYDGLKGQDDIPFPVETDRTETEQPLGTEVFQQILVEGAQDIDIEFVHGFFGVNVAHDQSQLDGLALDTFGYHDAVGDRTAAEIFATTTQSANAGDDTIIVDQFGPLKPGQKATIGIFGSNFEVVTIEQTREQADGDLLVQIQGTFSNNHSDDEPVKPFYLQAGFGSPFLKGDGSQFDDLNDLAAQLGLRVWQTMDGTWRVMRDISLGESIPTGPDLLTYDADTDTLSEAGSSLSADQPSVTNDEWSRDTERGILRKIIKATIRKEQGRGDRNPVRDPGLEDGPGVGTNSSPWLPLVGDVSRAGDGAATGEFSLEFRPDGAVKGQVRQYIEWVSPQIDGVEVQIFQAVADAGNIAFNNDISIYIWGRDGTKWYANSDAEWQSTATTIPKDQIGPLNPGFFMDIDESPPIAGLLVLEYETDSEFGVLIDDVRLRPDSQVNVRDTGEKDGRKLELRTKFVNTAGARIRAQKSGGSFDQVQGWYPNSPNWLRGVLDEDLSVNILAIATGPNMTGTNGSYYKHSGFSPTVTDSFSSAGEDEVDLEWDGQDTLGALDDDATVTGEYDLLSDIQGLVGGGAAGGNVLSTNQGSTGSAVSEPESQLSTSRANQSHYLHSGFTSTITESWSAPPSEDPSGISWDAFDIFSITYTGQNIFRHSGRSATIKASFDLGTITPNTIDANGIDVTVSGNNDTIYNENTQKLNVRLSGFTSTVNASFSSPFPGGATTYQGDYYNANRISDRYLHRSGFSQTIVDSFASPGSSPDPYGMGVDGNGDFVVQDASNDTFYHLSGFTATVQDSYSNHVANMFGTAWADWQGRTGETAGSASDGDYFEHSGFSATVTNSFSAPGPLPTALTWTGDDAIGADEENDTFYRHSSFTDTVTDSFSAGNDLPYGVSWDGNDLLATRAAAASGAAQLGADETFAGGENASNLLRFSAFTSTLTDSFSSPGDRPTGVTWDGSDLYSVDNQADAPGGSYYHHSGFSNTVVDSFSQATFAHELSIDQFGDFLATERDESGSPLTNDILVKLSGFTATVQNSFQAADDNLTGVTWDGSDTYWTVPEFASAGGNAYRNSGFTSTVKDSFSNPFGGISQIALSHDGTDLFDRHDNGVVARLSGFSDTITDSFDTGVTDSDFGGLEWGNYTDRTGATSGLGAGVSHVKHSGFRSSIIDSYSAPLSDPKGLVWTNGHVHSVDGTGRSLQHSAFTSTVTDSFSTPGTDPEGVSWNDPGLLTEDTSTATHYQHSDFSSTVQDSYSTPGSDPWGIEWSNYNERSQLESADFIGTHLKHSGFSDTILDSYSSPDDLPTGMTWDGSGVLSADTQSNTHYNHSGFTATIDDSYSYPSSSPEDMTWDGSNVRSMNPLGGNAIQHSGFSASIIDSFSLPGSAGTGITYEHGTTYTADEQSHTHYEHSDFTATVTDSYSTPNIEPGGMTWDGDDIVWISRSTENYFRQSGFSSNVNDSFSSPGPDPYAPTTDNLSNRVSQGTSEGQLLKRSGFSATIIDSLFTPGPNPSGVTADGSGLVFSADEEPGIDTYYQHSGFTTTVTDSFSFSNNSALGHDGTDLLSTKFTDQTVRRHSGFSDTITDSFVALAQFNLIDGVSIWAGNVLTYEENTDSHYRHSGFTNSILESYSTPYARGAGLTIDSLDARTGSGGTTKFSYSTDTGLDSHELREIVLGPLTSRKERATVKSFTADTIEVWRPLEEEHPDGEVIRPVFTDLTELRMENLFRLQGDELQLYQGQLWGLYPPESTPQYDGKTLVVRGGVELDLINELTTGVWAEKPATYEKP